jgi:hypothetical protein
LAGDILKEERRMLEHPTGRLVDFAGRQVDMPYVAPAFLRFLERRAGTWADHPVLLKQLERLDRGRFRAGLVPSTPSQSSDTHGFLEG